MTRERPVKSAQPEYVQEDADSGKSHVLTPPDTVCARQPPWHTAPSPPAQSCAKR